MCGKATSQILRFSMFIHSIELSLKLVETYSEEFDFDKFRLSANLEKFMDKIDIIEENLNIVQLCSIKRAYNLSSFFNKNKLVLAEFKTENWEDDICEILEGISLAFGKKSNINEKENDLIKKILEHENSEFTCNEFNQTYKGKFNAEMIQKGFNKLNDIGLGYVRVEYTGSFKKVY